MAIIRGQSVEEMMAVLREYADANGNGKIDLTEAVDALATINKNKELEEAEKKALRIAVIKEVVMQTGSIVIGVILGMLGYEYVLFLI